MIGFINSANSGSSSVGANLATLSPTKPSGVSLASDLWLVNIFTARSANGSGVTAGTYNPPGTFTEIGSPAESYNSNGTSHIQVQSYWAPGNAGAPTFNLSGSGVTGFTAWDSIGFSGVDMTHPIDVFQQPPNSALSTATLATSALSIATANAWHCIAHANWQVATTPTVAGFTVLANYVLRFSYNTTPKAIGSTGTVNIVETSGVATQNIVGRPFALRPLVTTVTGSGSWTGGTPVASGVALLRALGLGAWTGGAPVAAGVALARALGHGTWGGGSPIAGGFAGTRSFAGGSYAGGSPVAQGAARLLAAGHGAYPGGAPAAAGIAKLRALAAGYWPGGAPIAGGIGTVTPEQAAAARRRLRDLLLLRS